MFYITHIENVVALISLLSMRTDAIWSLVDMDRVDITSSASHFNILLRTSRRVRPST